MTNQVLSESTTLYADAFSARLAQIIQLHRLNQSEFARRLDTSAGFVGDILRGLKKPGHEFLFKLKSTFSVSIDWLLTGEGTMYSATKIDIELLQAVRLQVSVARLAILEDDATARDLLLRIRDGLLDLNADNTELDAFLGRINSNDADWCLALALYNGHLWTDNPDYQRRNLLEAAKAHFEVNKPADKLASLGRSPKTVQINISPSQRVAGRDYNEH
ncbi:MAG: hypothetical protein BVN34_00925 [Proteobacteria bacterium ST_bin12]|nr:MAG: hypothetical protein BVN34_00925 [Proteobacteria bacterium ST_bin12]